MNRGKKFRLFILFVLIFLNCFFITFYFFQKNQKFEIAFINVGQGNATIIKTENNKKIIIDSGNEMLALKNISSYVGFFGRKFDMSFITHYDIDHAGLFPFFLDNFKMNTFFESKVYNDNFLRNEIIKKVKQKSGTFSFLSAGDKIFVDVNTNIEVLFPDDFFFDNSLDENESSLVLKINYKNQSVLITGDLPKKFEKYLVKKYGDKLKADVLVAGHHGSATSSSEEFLEVVNPKYIVISVGKDNSYNLPNKDVIERMKKLNIPILRTDEIGNVIFNFKDNELILKE